MGYGYKKESQLSFANAVTKVKNALLADGFGILTEIDVRATLKSKLGIDYDNYLILGVCNPSLAHQALLAEKDIGLFMPCNVIVYEQGGKSFVSAMMPTVALQAVANPAVNKIAEQAETKLKKIIDIIE